MNVQHTKAIFDWTINLGHILTFVGFIFAGFIGFTMLDKRVVVMEQITSFQSQRDAAQDQRATESKSEVRDALRDINASLVRLNDKLDSKGK